MCRPPLPGSSFALSLNPASSSNICPFMLIARNVDRKKNYAVPLVAGGEIASRDRKTWPNTIRVADKETWKRTTHKAMQQYKN
ncbi:hypothetical protein LSAT2_004096 [Lamellibrachia satsuma]|nr:hypothetical protein LSAT2_004096 [Lamellibrachia satsuma]